MAFDLDRQYRVPATRKWFFKFGGRDIVQRYRGLRRSLGASPSVDHRAPSLTGWQGKVFDIDWELAARAFSTQQYAFIDPFFSSDFHERISQYWPSKAYLEPSKKASKWYDTGYYWKFDYESPRCWEPNPALDLLIEHLGSDEFLGGLGEVVGGKLEFHELHVTDAGPGAEVPMHLDSLIKGPRADLAVGLAIFVNGSGGENSGGLSVSGSSSWSELSFEPKKLSNTALLYSKRLHHGFRPIASGKFRRSINTRFRAALG